MTSEPLDRRKFLALLGAAFGTGTAGILKLLNDDPAAAAARRSRRALGGPVASGGPGATSTSTTTALGTSAQPDAEIDTVSTVADDAVPIGERILVLITLHGGNDALNTVVPMNAGRYRDLRGSLALSSNSLLPLGDGYGLHPSLKRLHGRWQSGQLAVVRGVGLPQPNRSHFLAMDMWQSASMTPVRTGWLGRWLDRTKNGPLPALAMGNSLPLALRGERTTPPVVPAGALTIPGGAAFATAFQTMARNGGPELMRDVAAASGDLVGLLDRLRGTVAMSPDASSASLEAGSNATEKHLATVAALVAGGLPTKVYTVSMGGFDTHADQLAAHARLLADLDTAIGGFLDRAARTKRGRGIVVAVHSEFGRRVHANGSGGTDHGAAGHMFLVGDMVRGGFHGDDPGLTRLDNNDLRVTTDFRAVYGSLLEQVLGVEAEVSLAKGTAALPLLR